MNTITFSKTSAGKLLLGSGLALVLVLQAPAARAGAADPARSAELFDQTAAELDLHGDMFVYFQIEDLLEGLLGKIKGAAEGLASHQDSAAATADVVTRIDAFLRARGLYDGVSIGISSKPRKDGLYEVKSFIARRPATPDPLFWRMLGGAPRELRVLDLIPADAALVFSVDVQPADIWTFLQAALQEIGGEETYKELRTAADGLKESAGTDVDALLAALSGEMAASLQMARDKTIELPLGGQSVGVPTPSLLVALGVKDNSLLQWLLQSMKANDVAFEEKQEEGRTAYVAPAVSEAPFALQPAFAQHEGFLLMGSHPDVIAEAIGAFHSGKGLKADPRFQALTASLPAEHNGLTYIDERFKVATYEIQMAAIRSDMSNEDAELVRDLLDQFFGWSKEGSVASVRVMKPNGILTHSVTPTGGKELMLVGAAMPLGLVAAVAVPSVVRARSRAQEVQMINTLRMADAAKEQWALESGKQPGDEVTEKDISPYLKAGGVNLPPGHTLILNPVGEKPIITRPDGSKITLP